MNYKTCEYCGANLDPDETCDCRIEGRDDDKKKGGEDNETVTAAQETYAAPESCYYGSRLDLE